MLVADFLFKPEDEFIISGKCSEVYFLYIQT